MLQSARGSSAEIFGSGGVSLESDENSEVTFGHTNRVSVRVQRDRVVSHVPISAVEVLQSEDARIKSNIEDVDTDEILQRLQELVVREYTYSPEWQAVREMSEGDFGVGNKKVRGHSSRSLREVPRVRKCHEERVVSR